eukprot:1157302-Pelagomonas_calceolata.AAC.28
MVPLLHCGQSRTANMNGLHSSCSVERLMHTHKHTNTHYFTHYYDIDNKGQYALIPIAARQVRGVQVAEQVPCPWKAAKQLHASPRGPSCTCHAKSRLAQSCRAKLCHAQPSHRCCANRGIQSPVTDVSCKAGGLPVLLTEQGRARHLENGCAGKVAQKETSIQLNPMLLIEQGRARHLKNRLAEKKGTKGN